LFLVIFMNATLAQNENLRLDQKMIRLCNWSYMSDIVEYNTCKTVLKDSLGTIGLHLAWGPEELRDAFGVAYSLLFVATDQRQTVKKLSFP